MRSLLLLLGCVASLSLYAQVTESDLQQAARYFHHAKTLAGQDGGRMWGQSLYGPMIFADARSRQLIANEPDSAGQWKKVGAVYTGTLPPTVSAANTALRWQGKVWAIVLWPLPSGEQERAALLMHEAFHRLQLLRELPMGDATAAHLETMEGRLLLQLELAALRQALHGEPSAAALQHALALRARRHQLFPGADSTEHILESNEGLAEYTGQVLSGQSDAALRQTLIRAIDSFSRKPSFVRSMAYATGPVYGLLLRARDPQWHRRLPAPKKADFLSFEQLLAAAYNLAAADAAGHYAHIQSAGLYGYDSLLQREQQLEEERLRRVAAYRRALVEGPVLALPNRRMNFVFNPSEVQVLEGHGPVYPTLRVQADWGTLQVIKGGALIRNWQTVFVPLPAGTPTTGSLIETADWKLELHEGWTLAEGDKKGSFAVKNASAGQQK